MADGGNIYDDKRRWYIMHHLSPTYIETMLRLDSDGQLIGRDPETGALSPKPTHFRFHIPYLYLPHVKQIHTDDGEYKRYRATEDKEALRNDLRDFVFIHATGERVRQIVESDWNRSARLHLRYHRDADGHAVTVGDQEMQALIDALQKQHYEFYFDQPVEDFKVDDVVTFQQGAWKGYSGVITRKRVMGDGRVMMTVSVNLFNRTTSVNLMDVQLGDVLFKEPEKGRLVTDNVLENVENEVLDLLGHRFRQRVTETAMEEDRLRLKRLYSLHTLYFEDSDQQQRFKALMFVCAYLLNHPKTVAMLRREVRALLGLNDFSTEVPAAETETQAYLMTALFIENRDREFREQVKRYRSAHPDSDIINRLFFKVKEIKTKRQPDPMDLLIGIIRKSYYPELPASRLMYYGYIARAKNKHKLVNRITEELKHRLDTILRDVATDGSRKTAAEKARRQMERQTIKQFIAIISGDEQPDFDEEQLNEEIASLPVLHPDNNAYWRLAAYLCSEQQ